MRPIPACLILSALLAMPLARSGETKEATVKPCPLPHGKWEPVPTFSDEFDGETLDAAKWYPNNPGWRGREPAFFNPQNVRVKEGMLHLDAKLEDLPNLPKQYHTYTTSFVKSKTLLRYGYIEIRAQAMDSQASSAFWFYDITPEQWTEIDVFEIGARKYPHKYYMNTHVFHTLVETVHWDQSKVWEAPYNLSKEFHVYGVEWDRDEIKFWIDGKVVRTVKNTHWHQALALCFDSETFKDWFGLPEKETLPATFSIDYVRTWRRLDGPPDDKPLALEFRFPGRKTGSPETRCRLKTDGAGTLVVRAKGGDERPQKLLLEYEDEAFFAAQTEKEIRKKVTVKDAAGKELGFEFLWNKQPRKGNNECALKAAIPNGYNPVGVDVLAGAKKEKGAADEYEFKAEDGAVVKVTVKWP